MDADFENRFHNLQLGVPPIKFDSESVMQQIEANFHLSNVIRERLGEILLLTNKTISGMENLAKKLESETASWRLAKLQNETRFGNLEKAVCQGLSSDALLIQE